MVQLSDGADLLHEAQHAIQLRALRQPLERPPSRSMSWSFSSTTSPMPPCPSGRTSSKRSRCSGTTVGVSPFHSTRGSTVCERWAEAGTATCSACAAFWETRVLSSSESFWSVMSAQYQARPSPAHFPPGGSLASRGSLPALRAGNGRSRGTCDQGPRDDGSEERRRWPSAAPRPTPSRNLLRQSQQHHLPPSSPLPRCRLRRPRRIRARWWWSEVVVLGAEKTLPETVQAYSRLVPGDSITQEELTRVERRLLATGLFQEVRVSTQSNVPGRVKVLLQVEDKASWVIAPTFTLSNANIGGGVLYAESNLWGRSKKFIAAAQVSTAESGPVRGLPGSEPLRLAAAALQRRGRSSAATGWRSTSRARAMRTPDGGSPHTAQLGLHGRRAVGDHLRAGARGSEVPADVHRRLLPSPGHAGDGARLRAGIDPAGRLAAADGGHRHAAEPARGDGGPQHRRLAGAGRTQGCGATSATSASGCCTGTACASSRSTTWCCAERRWRAWTCRSTRSWWSGGNSLRGYIYRQFRGDTRLSLTAEYHFPLFTVKSLSFRGVGLLGHGAADVAEASPRTGS